MIRKFNSYIAVVFTTAADLGFVLLIYYMLSFGFGEVDNKTDIELPLSSQRNNDNIVLNYPSVIINRHKDVYFYYNSDTLSYVPRQNDSIRAEVLYEKIFSFTKEFLDKVDEMGNSNKTLIANFDYKTEVAFLLPISDAAILNDYNIQLVTIYFD